MYATFRFRKFFLNYFFFGAIGQINWGISGHGLEHPLGSHLLIFAWNQN